MKTKLTSLFAILCMTGFSQVELAPIGAEWYYTYREGAFTPSAGYYRLEATKDTIIDSKKCSILTKHMVNSLGKGSYQGQEYIYNDTVNNRVFRYLFGQFYLLYDFSKEVGDTIVIKEPLSATEYDSIVVKVDSISYDDYSDQVRLKSQYVSVIFDLRSKWDFFGKNTEKLGNQYYFFPTNQLECDGGCPQPLRCYSDKDLEYHYYYSWWPCDTLYTYSEIPAQNISITDSLNRWNIGLNCISEEPIDPYNRWSTYFVHIEGDTVMNEKHYKRLVHCIDSMCIKKSYKSFIREDSGKVFLADKNREHILYDFNLKQGDTLAMYFLWDIMETEPLYVLIDSVRTGIFQDQKERIFQYVSVYPKYWENSFNDVLMEGIGSLRFGLEYPGNLFITGATQCYPNFLCFYSDDNLVNSNPEFNDCYITTGINQVQLKPELVNVFSAQNGILVAELSSSVPGTIFVFNSLGELVSQGKILNSTSRFCMPGSGVYLYRFVSDNGRTQTGKVLIR